MAYDFYIPCDPDNWTVATITEDKDLILNDYDIETDLSLEELGFDEPLCLKVLRLWEENPIKFICCGMIIPINDTGLVACTWARCSVIEVEDEFIPEDLRIVKESITLAEKHFLGKRVLYRRILDAKRRLAVIIANSTRYNYGKFSTKKFGMAANAERACLVSITNIEEQIATFGGIVNEITDFCDVASAAGHIIDERNDNTITNERQQQGAVFSGNFLLDTAIETLTNLQKSRGGLR